MQGPNGHFPDMGPPCLVRPVQVRLPRRRLLAKRCNYRTSAALSVDLANEEDSLTIEQDLLEEIKQQIDYCKIVVPEDVTGQVVYANKYNRRGAEWAPGTVGALPNTLTV